MKKIVFIAIVLAFVNCAGWSDPAQAQGKTFRWTSQGDAASLDPFAQDESLTHSINLHLYDPLMTRDKTMKIVPALATFVHQVSPLIWVITLLKGVKFHDGTPLTADDVVFSVTCAQQPTSGIRSSAAALGIPRKIDDFTVEFTTPMPDSLTELRIE